MQPTEAGFIDWNGNRTAYYCFGRGSTSRAPLVVLHGGPGSAHNYLLNLRLLTNDGWQVVMYDQIGCGRSTSVSDQTPWTVSTFIDEIRAVRDALHLDSLHLIGHSWGGMLAIDYLLTKPEGITSVILASTMVSMPLFRRELGRLRRQLPLRVRRTLARHERLGTVDSPEYAKAYAEFSDRYIFRQGSMPNHLSAPPGSFGEAVYRHMWGYSECCPNGSLKDWDRLDRLPELRLPVLITSGRFDELTPRQAELTAERITGAEQVIFEQSAHLAHIEEVGAYLDTLRQFLSRAR